MIKTLEDLVADMPDDVRAAYDRFKANPPKNVWGMRAMSADEMIIKHWLESNANAGEYTQYGD